MTNNDDSVPRAGHVAVWTKLESCWKEGRMAVGWGPEVTEFA